jgi:hypothetical protein
MNYLMDRPDVTQTEWSKSHQKEKGIPMSGVEARQAVMDAVETYIYRYVGSNDETNEMGKCYFNRLINDYINFNPNKWTDYDAFVASGLALVATKKYQPKQTKVEGIKFFKEYNTRPKKYF